MNIDTPKTNAFLMRGDEFRARDELIDLARDFERDVRRSNAEIERLRARNKRLEEALGRLRISAANYEDEDPALRAALKQARAALEEDK